MIPFDERIQMTVALAIVVCGTVITAFVAFAYYGATRPWA
jgi:hypothetical protein